MCGQWPQIASGWQSRGTWNHFIPQLCIIGYSKFKKGAFSWLWTTCQRWLWRRGKTIPLCVLGFALNPKLPSLNRFFPTCQVRVVRFYVSCRSFSFSSSPDLNYDDHSRVFAAGPQPRPSTPSVRCRTSTTTIHAQCSLPDLNHDHPRPVFAAGPQPRPATPSVRCRTSTTTIHAQCSLPDLNHDQPRPVFAAGPQPRPSTPSVRCRTSTPMPKAMPDRMSEKNAR